mgnify:FL=1
MPCGAAYDCITAEAPLHTLRRTDDESRTFGTDPTGTKYVATFLDATAGGGDNDELIIGNLNSDSWIDVLDFAAYVNRWGAEYDSDGDTVPDGDTPCGMFTRHADMSGNGTVALNDFTFLQINFLKADEPDCCGLRALAGDAPVTEIFVGELANRDAGELRLADLNGDGWVDQADIIAFSSGVRPKGKNPIGSGASSEARDSQLLPRKGVK